MDQNDYEGVCRICLENHNTLLSLFVKRKGVSPCDKFKLIKCNIEIYDGGSTFICIQCLAELDAVVSFIEKCEKANGILADRYVQTLSNKFDSEHTRETAIELQDSDPKLDYSQDQNVVSFGVEVRESFKETTIHEDIEVPCCGECGSRRRCQHWTPSKTHTCQYCQKLFTRKFNYKLHLKRHLGERDWPCPTCGVQQITRGLAEKHCATKSRKLCPEPGCGKSFTTITNLNTHIRVHNGDRPFQCNDCGKSFASKTRLGDHTRIHTGEKPYICPVCGKRFTTNKLSVHMWSHAEQAARPFACPKPGCTKRFSSGSALRAHSGVHARTVRVHACGTCGARYRHRQSLNKHARKRHPQVPPPALLLPSLGRSAAATATPTTTSRGRSLCHLTLARALRSSQKADVVQNLTPVACCISNFERPLYSNSKLNVNCIPGHVNDFVSANDHYVLILYNPGSLI